MEKKETKLCKHCQTEIPKKAKVCPNCKRRQGGIGCLGVVLLVLGVFIFIGSFGASMSKDKNPEKVGEVGTELSETGTQIIDNTFNVGDVVETDNFRITYESAGEYTNSNEFLQPKDGYVYWEFKFKFENISNTDQTVSTMMDWECYADNSKADQTWIVDDNGLDGKLSAGREAEGAVYFEVPKDAENIELEYDINFWQSDKIIFVGK
nr:MAG TPA: protein of unknown function DUF5067 [Caudoviricetes sp.]